jgi:hypothetical protein
LFIGAKMYFGQQGMRAFNKIFEGFRHLLRKNSHDFVELGL